MVLNLKEIHPVLPVKDVKLALNFYTKQLGFELCFMDSENAPGYAGVRKEGAEIHLQWHHSSEWVDGIDRPQLRILCADPDILFRAWRHLVGNEEAGLRDTPWGTREFGVYDPDGNGLIFYRNI
ncbi:glyoxalase superfamily protein [Robertkochia flava]|uniref:glyoxalase superfamily protein n=1 Tax=Robertkochia flava TaxID=3447986 RepID=UPI001CCE6340|nr:glyoxalase superfamily protein [Robertkochia marina]